MHIHWTSQCQDTSWSSSKNINTLPTLGRNIARTHQSQSVMETTPSALSQKVLPPFFQRRHQACPAGDREYPILCPRCGPHCPHGFEHYHKQASKRDKITMTKTKQLLNYLAMHPDATVHFHASDMILNIHLDASYLLAANAHSRACRHFFMGWKADPTKPIKLYGAFFYAMRNPTIRHRLRGRSRIRGIIPQLQTSNNF